MTKYLRVRMRERLFRSLYQERYGLVKRLFIRGTRQTSSGNELGTLNGSFDGLPAGIIVPNVDGKCKSNRLEGQLS